MIYFCQVFPEAAPDLLQNGLQAVLPPAEVIADVDGGKKIPGGFRGKVAAQIDGDGDDHRLFAVPHPHPRVDGAEENRRHQLRQCNASGPRTGQDLVQGHPALQDGQMVSGQALPPDLIGGGRTAHGAALGLLIVLLEAVRLLLGGGRVVGQDRDRLGELLRAAQQQILIDQGAQKVQRAGAVCQRVVDLQADPPAVVEDAEEQAAADGGIDRAAGGQLLAADLSGKGAVLQIVPEPPTLHHRAVYGEPLHRPVQGPLQELGLHRLPQLADEPEDLGVVGGAGGWKDLRGVVQRPPGGNTPVTHGVSPKIG